jgi:MFS family permease
MGIAATLVIRGYQFGGGNHSVYLIAPLRQVHPELLANDWWTTKTLQYHVVFTNLTAGLMKLGIERTAFAVMYFGLVVLMHLAWLRLVLRLGFDGRVYLFSVLLYYLSAGGTGLGGYQFLQDSSFLPGNVANTAMLWGLVWWIEGRVWRPAVGLAAAGLFHLNHALVAIGFWGLGMRSVIWPGVDLDAPSRKRRVAALIGGFLLIMALALPNIIPAVRMTLAGGAKLPLDEFVQLYVKLRHPHHYDPLSWPIALWLSFLWPIPLAYVAWRRMRHRAEARRAASVFIFFSAIMAVAFVFAGVFFISEPLIQMSLFRFSTYPKLLSCIGAAAVLLDPKLLDRPAARRAMLALPVVALMGLLAVRLWRTAAAPTFVGDNLTPLLLFIALLAGGVVYVTQRMPHHRWMTFTMTVVLSGVLLAAWANRLGLRIATHDRADADYLAMCDWVRRSTPADAVFLLPPNEHLFRFHARRAIVVNFKGVPQLSSEMPEWKRRLEDVLDQPLSNLPRRFDRTHDAIARRYDELSAVHLRRVSRAYRARYVMTTRPVEGLGPAVFENASCHLYDLSR